MTDTVAAIVLNYRNWEGTVEVVESLRRQSTPPKSLLVIDNGSNQPPSREITDRLATSKARIVPLHANLGYAGAMNHASQESDVRSCESLLLMTHDCILDPRALEALVNALAVDQSVAAAGPLLGWRDAPQRVFSGGGVFRPGGLVHHISNPPLMADWNGKPAQSVDWLDGAALLIRRSAWESLGGLEESYFLYFEDVDFGLRACIAGWRIVVVPSARAWQQPGNFTPYLYMRNRLLLVKRIGTSADRRAFLRRLPAFLLHLARVGRMRGLYWGLRGVFDGLRGKSGSPPFGSGRSRNSVPSLQTSEIEAPDTP
jgi:N-acetylglucosaminyl-diphospho-decaprenol L-rhamnosyltransferase